MTDKRITELDTIPSTIVGTEYIPVVQSGVTYKMTLGNLRDWSNLGLNHPPTAQDFTITAVDTDQGMSGNLFDGAADQDGDPLTIQNFSYNGSTVDWQDGSFQTALGYMYLQDTGAWTYNLGAGARALNIGDVGHEMFTYTLSDGRGGLTTHPLTISITGTNSVPVVNYFNGSTPINTTVSGNLIAHYSFDYESAVTVLHYTIAGVTGTWSAGASTTIPGVGLIEINANGDYEFVPADGFYGPVPLITYTLTDVGSPPNLVPAFLTLAVTPLAPGVQPIIIGTDIVSGPTSGGENNKGTYLTIWGFRFGTSSAMGVTTHLKIGGHEVDNYRELVTDQLNDPWTGMQRMTVQIGALGGSVVMGTPLPIVLTVSGNDSNADKIFTPNPGRIFFVSLTGNDTTAVIGDINHPFRSLQHASRGDRSFYSECMGGDTAVLRAGDWSDIGYANCWLRFRDPQQQGSNPSGASGSGWIWFMPYPGEDVHYTTTGDNLSGGIEGPGDAFSGTCGDWVGVSKLRMEVQGGSSGAAAPVNMQYNTGHWRVVGNTFGPWIAGTSPSLNAACVTGQGNFIEILLNTMDHIEGVAGVLQNHGVYAGTSSYGWKVYFNRLRDMLGGSGIQFNDSDGGTGNLSTPFGVWEGFTDHEVHHNWIEHTAKYGLTFSDIGAYTGDLSFKAYNNVFIRTGLPSMRLNTTTATSEGIYAFNTSYNCNTVDNAGTGNAVVRNEGDQSSPNHNIKVYNNILAFGPDTVAGTKWFADYSGLGTGYDFKRNVYYQAGQSPTIAPPASDSLAIVGDPKFNAPTATPPDLSLQSSSPAANAGTQSLVYGLIVNDDFTALSTRQFGGAPDVGAYEIGQTTPYPITAPTSSGGPRVAVVTSTNLGTWGNAPTGYSRQYTLDNVASGSANTGTGAYTFTPTGVEANQVLRCEFTVTNGEGSTSYTLTIGTIAVGAGAATFTAPPTITGTPQSGVTLSCSTGTTSGGAVTGHLYQWKRSGTNVGSNSSTATYAQTDSDVGYNISCAVTAVDTTNGSVIANATAVGPVAPAAADPVVVQHVSHSMPSGATTTFALTGLAGANNVLAFINTWDNATYNANYTDTQGHTYSNFTVLDNYTNTGGNPQVGGAFIKSASTGDYTLSIAPGAVSSACGVVMEIGGLDPTTFLDIPAQHANGDTGAPAITFGTATTKGNDLILVALTIQGISLTVTPASGWTLVDSIDGVFTSLFVYKRKTTTTETPAFSATIGDGTTNYNWLIDTATVKGST